MKHRPQNPLGRFLFDWGPVMFLLLWVANITLLLGLSFR